MAVNTKVFVTDEKGTDPKCIEEAAAIIRSGGLLAIPTETVYGLGADATLAKASQRIYAAKGRPSDNPLIVHIANLEDLEKVAIGDLTKAKILARVFWPGPLTMVLKKSELIPYATTGGLDTVAVRMPDFWVTRKIIEAANVPIAAPSANISGKPSPTCAEHVYQDLNGIIEGIVDAGRSIIGLESTIVDLTSKEVFVLRKGYIKSKELEKVLGEKVYESGFDKKSAPKAPGMKYKHYAPQAKLYIVKGSPQKVAEEIRKRVLWESAPKTAVVGTEKMKEMVSELPFFSLGKSINEDDIMHNLYATLRKLDDEGIEVAYVEDLSYLRYGDLLMERLEKASGGNIIETD